MYTTLDYLQVNTGNKEFGSKHEDCNITILNKGGFSQKIVLSNNKNNECVFYIGQVLLNKTI